MPPKSQSLLTDVESDWGLLGLTMWGGGGGGGDLFPSDYKPYELWS